VKRTEKGVKYVYVVTLSAVALLWLIWDFVQFTLSTWNGRSKHSSVFLVGLMRIFVLNSVMVILGFIVLGIIDESKWAKDIAAGRSYRLPPQSFLVDSMKHDGDPVVLPTRTDVLIAPEYAAEHLAGYGRILDYAHPGNVLWNAALRSYGSAYRTFSAELQLELCQSLLDSFQTESRFLKQGQERQFLAIEDRNELFDICHRDLIAATDKKAFDILRGLNSLKTNAAFGRFANTAMQRTHGPQHLKRWEHVLVPRREWKVILGPRESVEPFSLAWVREGDYVEALFECTGDCKSKQRELCHYRCA